MGKLKISNKRKRRTRAIAQDKISDLNDSLIHHILSFLDMKEVVQTSFISKRWRYLWKTVPDLSFDYSLWKSNTSASPYVKRVTDQNECMNFVDRVLIFRDRSSSIRKLNLSSHYCWDFERLITWLMIAATLHVKEVHIESIAPKIQLVPGILFTQDIEVLKLDVYLRLPASLYPAPNLKTLQVYLDLLPQGDSDALIIDLDLSLPALETLIIQYCDDSHLKFLDISSSRLENLVLEQYGISPQPLPLKLHTPCLRSLHFTGCCPSVDCYPKDIASLVSAAIDPYYLDTGCLVKALKGFCNLTTLKLSGLWLTFPRNKQRNRLFALKNLKRFRLRTGTDSCIRTIANFLKSTPCIENIVMEIQKRNPGSDWGELLSFKHKFCHLRHVTFKNLQGCDHELNILEFIMKNGVVLESIKSTSLKSLVGRERVLREFKEKYESLRETSSQINYSTHDEPAD